MTKAKEYCRKPLLRFPEADFLFNLVKPTVEVIRRPKRGGNALFLSLLSDQTMPFYKDSGRMVVAFDLMPDNP